MEHHSAGRVQSAYFLLDTERRAHLERRIIDAIEQRGGTYQPGAFAVLAVARLQR